RGRRFDVDGQPAAAVSGRRLRSDAGVLGQRVVAPEGQDRALGVEEADLPRHRRRRERPAQGAVELRAADDVPDPQGGQADPGVYRDATTFWAPIKPRPKMIEG